MQLLLLNSQLNKRLKIAVFSLLILSFLIIFSRESIAGCCISADYNAQFSPNQMGCDGILYFEQECTDSFLAPYTQNMCCVLNISGANECYYGSEKLCKAKSSERGATGIQYLSTGDFGENGDNCTSNAIGGCVGILPEINCRKEYNIETRGCIEETEFLCDSDGILKSDCTVCLDGNCGSLVCNRESGSCEIASANNCTTIGYECCPDCKEGSPEEEKYSYQEGKSGVCTSNEARCCMECSTAENCCEFRSQCPTSTGQGRCSPGRWECSQSCIEPACALGLRISSNDISKGICRCGADKKYIASDSGYCCEIAGIEGGVYSTTPCVQIGSAQLSGMIKEDNSGIPGARVIIPRYGLVSLVTGADGKYSVGGLKIGESYTAYAYASGYYMLSKSIEIASENSYRDFILTKIGSQQCDSSSLGKIAGFDALPSPGKKEEKLVWDNSCSDFIILYKIKRQGLFTPEIIISPANDNYVDSNVKWGESYTYTITAIYTGGSVSNSTTIKMGNSLCEGVLPGYEFCLNSKNEKNTNDATLRRACDENNELSVDNVYVSEEFYGYESTDCSVYEKTVLGKHVCVITRNLPEPEAGIVISKCKKEDACGSSGNPFGLFFEKNICINSQNECYYDFSKTSVDVCGDCRADLKCSELISEETCLNNPCGLNCLWTETNAELSKGICYSPYQPPEGNETDKGDYNSTCDACNALFVSCTSEVCGALGNCVKGIDGCAECESDVSCTDYLDQVSCEGYPTGFYTYGDGITHYTTNDACHSLRCYWNSTISACLKDGNFDDNDDCKNFGPLTNELCKEDNIPPVTTITSNTTIRPTEPIIFNMSEKVRKFSYCIDVYDSCAPIISTDAEAGKEFSSAVIHPLEDDSTKNIFQSNGIYYVRFYSIDKYNNMEIIRSVPVYVLKNILNAEVIYFFEDANKYNLTIITEMNSPAKCTFTITPNVLSNIVKNDFASQEYKPYFELKFA
ncbi:MAG: carboxypeptidase-like regulatory domain-containing protein, partial [Candidatus Woesearchaeota archaeon]|nr:carboxypeptidase-like regulatory domain-containing protein [Candidatus Woesearchaeota archaeon]